MTLGQLVHVLRWSFACAVLLAGSVIGLFVLLMMREGIPRTEGSPAGAVIAAVLLASVLAAPILLIAGAALVLKLAKRPWPQPESDQPLSEAPPALRGEFWLTHANGAQLGAIFNAGRAVLIWVAATDQAAACTQGARAPPGQTTHHFVDARGRLLKLPYGLTLPEVLARSEQEHFKVNGERSDALDWSELDSALPSREDAWELAALTQSHRRNAHAGHSG
ncbi:MAG: hypothetical protein ACK5PG_01090 [Lysobacterales bacterium]